MTSQLASGTSRQRFGCQPRGSMTNRAAIVFRTIYGIHEDIYRPRRAARCRTNTLRYISGRFLMSTAWSSSRSIGGICNTSRHGYTLPDSASKSSSKNSCRSGRDTNPCHQRCATLKASSEALDRPDRRHDRFARRSPRRRSSRTPATPVGGGTCDGGDRRWRRGGD